jgi:hypothetical protein
MNQEKMSKRTVLSIGSGLPQLDFIKALKKRNFEVVSIGKGRNSDEAIFLSDDFIEVDTHDETAVINWLRSYKRDIHAVGSFAGGMAIGTLQKAVKELELIPNIPDALMVGMDKFSQQHLYEKYNLSSIKSLSFKEIKDDVTLIAGIKQFIVKPIIGRGSEGVSVVNKDELLRLISTSLFDSSTIVQEFREGVEYRVLILVQNGELKLLAPVIRESYHDTFFLGRLRFSDHHETRIRSYFTSFFRSVNLQDCILKADVLVSPNNIDMIEMDIGVGGGIYYKKYISELFSYDLINQYINLIVNEPVLSSRPPKHGKIMDYIYNTTGKSFKYDVSFISNQLNSIIGKHLILTNLLKPEDTGNMMSNADFILTIIHEKREVSNYELNSFINKNIFING